MAIEIDMIETHIEEHMNAQPYECLCTECGKPLEVSASIDNDMDIALQVQPCATCLKAAEEEGVESCQTDTD